MLYELEIIIENRKNLDSSESYIVSLFNKGVKEIAKKVNKDFNKKQLPLMLGMINAIVDDKKLELDWEAFR